MLRRYKLIALATVISLLSTFQGAVGAANPKAGLSCNKINEIKVYKNLTFTCIKSGKKLIWSQGVPSPEAIQPKEIGISIDNLDLKGVAQKAYDQVSKEIKTRPRVNYVPTFIIGPNVKKYRVDQELTGLYRAIDFWGPYFIPDKFQIIYVDYGDENWLDQKSSELGLSSMLPQGQTWRQQFTQDSDCAFGMAGNPNGIPTFVQCLGFPFYDGSRQGAPHEYTHLFQLGVAKGNAFNLSWYTEGSATFFGWTIAMFGYNPLSRQRSDFFNSTFSQMSESAKTDIMSKDITKLKSRMQSISGRNTKETSQSGSYWLGGLAFEVLTALYGVDKFIELSKKLETTNDISSLLNQTYGFSADYFYEKLAPYVWGNIPN